MLIEKHLISNKTNADRKTDVKNQPYGSCDSRPGHAHSSARTSWAKGDDTEKLEDPGLINQADLLTLWQDSVFSFADAEGFFFFFFEAKFGV
jgi:hypothetical protein